MDDETRLTREKRAGVLLIGAAQLMEEAALCVGRRHMARDLRNRAERTAAEGVRLSADAEELLKELRGAESAEAMRDKLVRAQAEARGWRVRAQRAEEHARLSREDARLVREVARKLREELREAHAAADATGG